MSAIYVGGQSVMTAARIEAIGVTGRGFGPHLHFKTYPVRVRPREIYRATCPAKWLAERDVKIEAAPLDSAR